MDTKAFLESRDQRKRVEMRFAHLKTHHRFERMRLRGLSGARDEFHLAAIVNLSVRELRSRQLMASASRQRPARASQEPDQPRQFARSSAAPNLSARA